MATLPTSSRLFAKVAKFVRNPNVHWSDLDKIEAEGEGGSESVIEPTLAHNRQTLKDMIDRKRHEDAIRKCEFDELRQLRRQASIARPDLSDKPSTFGSPTNISDLDERAMTLRKIDEIEAQMSRQWWKGQGPALQAEAVPPQPDVAVAQARSASVDSLFTSTQVKNSRIDFDDIPTLLGPAPTLQNEAQPHGSHAPWRAEASRQAMDDRGFGPAKLFVSELDDNLADPDLEEAAVRFANGDDAGAESVLLAALRAQPALSAVAQAQAEALFDLYRSLGQQASFEREALNFSRQFGCPAAAWLPPPAAHGSPSAVVPQVWFCPARLELPALAQLPGVLPVTGCLSLNWSGLQEIAAPAAQQLAHLMAAWSTQDACLEFEGERVLVDVLCAATPRGARQTAPFWWALRMDLLRILQWQDDFELAAFEFCVTFESAPSPWTPARCRLRHPELAATHRASPVQPIVASATPPQGVVLTGELQGDVVLGLPALDEVGQQTNTLVVFCSELVRVDFSAAGSILNWVARGQALGCQIEFRDVPFLVAAFFNLIGINQHARVLTRVHQASR